MNYRLFSVVFLVPFFYFNPGGVADDVSSKEKIIAYLKLGKSNKEIAELCDVSVRTVERYKKSLTTSDNDTKNDKRHNEKNKINWLKLENEYVTDIGENPITLKGLSEKYDISFNTIEDYSKKNNWKEKRKEYHGNVTEKFKEKLSDQTADVMAQIVGNINSALLKATTELHTHEEVNGFGQLITRETETVRTSKLDRLVKAITSLQKVEIEKQKLEILKAQKVKKANLPPAYFDDMDQELDNEE